MLTRDPSSSGVTRSTSTPFTSAMIAALAKPLPMSRARSATVAPLSNSRWDPSGRVIVIAVMNVYYRSVWMISVNIQSSFYQT